MKKKLLLTVGVLVICFVAYRISLPKNRNLRGSYLPSDDQRTYLVIVDDNGGACEPLLIDRAAWLHSKGERGPISPGDHLIQCGSDDSGMSFTVPQGTIFSFDYWGP